MRREQGLTYADLTIWLIPGQMDMSGATPRPMKKPVVRSETGHSWKHQGNQAHLRHLRSIFQSRQNEAVLLFRNLAHNELRVRLAVMDGARRLVGLVLGHRPNLGSRRRLRREPLAGLQVRVAQPHLLYGVTPMSQVEELQVRIRDLPEKDFSKLREWFFQLEDELWDQQISADFRAGKFNRLIFTPGKSRACISLDAC